MRDAGRPSRRSCWRAAQGGDRRDTSDGGGSDGPSVSEGKVEHEVSMDLEASVGQAPDRIDYPDDLRGEVGTELCCTLYAGRDRLGVTVTVTSVDGCEIDFDFAETTARRLLGARRRPDRSRHLRRERAGRRSATPTGCGRATTRWRSPRPRRSPPTPTWCTGSTTSGGPRSPGSGPTPPTARSPGSRSALGDDLLVVTQNVDDLHERAGSRRVLHMHGRLRSAWCTACDDRHEWTGALRRPAALPGLRRRASCARTSSGSARSPTRWTGSRRRSGTATSSSRSAPRAWSTPPPPSCSTPSPRGARTLELNLDASDGSSDFDVSRRGPATELVPAWVEELAGQLGA